MKKITRILISGLVAVATCFADDPPINGLKAGAPLIPQGGFPSHSSVYGHGGWHSVTSVTDMANLPSYLRYKGMAVYVRATSNLYVLATNEIDWESFIASSNGTPVYPTQTWNQAGVDATYSTNWIRSNSNGVDIMLSLTGVWNQAAINATNWTNSPAYGITVSDTNNWTTAYGWANHALAGYFKADGTVLATGNFNLSGYKITNAAAGVATNDFIILEQLTQVTNFLWLNDMSISNFVNFATNAAISDATNRSGIFTTNYVQDIKNMTNSFVRTNGVGAVGYWGMTNTAGVVSWTQIVPGVETDPLSLHTNGDNPMGADLEMGDYVVSGQRFGVSSPGSGSAGFYWIAVGAAAGINASGNNWGAFGNSAGASAAGDYWHAFGRAAGLGATGNNWTAVGYYAGMFASHTNSIVLGSYAGRAARGSNRVYADSYATDPGYAANEATNDMIFGDTGYLYLGRGAGAPGGAKGGTLRGSWNVGGTNITGSLTSISNFVNFATNQTWIASTNLVRQEANSVSNAMVAGTNTVQGNLIAHTNLNGAAAHGLGGAWPTTLTNGFALQTTVETVTNQLWQNDASISNAMTAATNQLQLELNIISNLTDGALLTNGTRAMEADLDMGSTYGTSNGIINCDFISGRTNLISFQTSPNHGLLLCVGTNIFAYGPADNSYGKDIMLLSHGVDPKKRLDSPSTIWSNTYGAMIRMQGQPRRNIQIYAGRPSGYLNQEDGYVTIRGYGGHGAELLISSNVIVKTPLGSTGAVANLYIQNGYARCPNFTTSLDDCLVNWSTLSSYYNSSTNYAYENVLSVSNFASAGISNIAETAFLTNGTRVMNGNIVFTNWLVGFNQVTPGISNCSFVAGGEYYGSLYLTPGGSASDSGVIAYGYRTNFTNPTDVYTTWDYDRGSRIAAIARNAFLQAGTGGFVIVQIGNSGNAAMVLRTNSVSISGADLYISTSGKKILASYVANANNEMVNWQCLTNYIATGISTPVVPTTDGTQDLGSPDKQWRDLHMTGSTVYMNKQKVLGYDASGSNLITYVPIVTVDTNNPGITNTMAYLELDNTYLSNTTQTFYYARVVVNASNGTDIVNYQSMTNWVISRGYLTTNGNGSALTGITSNSIDAATDAAYRNGVQVMSFPFIATNATYEVTWAGPWPYDIQFTKVCGQCDAGTGTVWVVESESNALWRTYQQTNVQFVVTTNGAQGSILDTTIAAGNKFGVLYKGGTCTQGLVTVWWQR